MKNKNAVALCLALSSMLHTFPLYAQVATGKLPAKADVWVFIMAGQSNMAGRATIQAEDTVTNGRIFTVNSRNEIVLAKEPLHFYEPSIAGLDCGLSFARTLLPYIPPSVSLLMIPAAVGGSAIDQWLGDSLHRGVKLLSNFKEKMAVAKKRGTIKAILWHQGESDAKPDKVQGYQKKLALLFGLFRDQASNNSLPVVTAPIGTFTKDTTLQGLINKSIRQYAAGDKYTLYVPAGDFRDKGDSLHFDSPSQRLMGRRMATAFFNNKKTQNKTMRFGTPAGFLLLCVNASFAQNKPPKSSRFPANVGTALTPPRLFAIPR